MSTTAGLAAYREAIDPAFGHEQAVRRVEDWKTRIDGLFNAIEGWLADRPDLHVRRTRTTTMHEGLMKQHGVPAVALPVLDIERRGDIVATIRPDALWIIGVNGRLVMYRGDRHFYIRDLADPFEPPEWSLFDLDSRTARALTKETLLGVL